MISKSNIKSHSSPELNDTQNHCEIKVSKQPTSYRISHVILPDIVCSDDSHISEEVSYKSKKNNDSLFSNDIFNKFEENTPEVPNPDDVIPNVICSHNAFDSCRKLVQCKARALNELDFG
ncbi:hypothetical protein MS3_00001075 [Schistosoma haematobium]|uniref:Uncharacterized protein n=1 Tax=Schistosoma haematobium TaxID=6185 RepID=A0A922LMT7_SCHHA|nr:hypothetical protein MS3_00001075 [Schistosoma haematobium]KAH9589855.1 hypothetical protein MS3_00001075 [Schistosoma haematobium]